MSDAATPKPDPRPHLLAVAPDELAAWLRAHHQPDFRLDQILGWVFCKWADSFDAMTELPAALRISLAGSFDLRQPRELERLRSADGGTGKLLLELDDAAQVECVWMTDRGRVTFCISSQAGCSLDCRFCATGAAGPGRNLSTAELLAQVAALARVTGAVRNVVFMGMGEPLLNLDALLPALDALADPKRFAVSPRHITVSTAGITPGIIALARSPVRPHLALSLNSPFDDQRSELMPVNRRHPLADVLAAADEYVRQAGRRLLIEYVLLGGVNTSRAAASALADIALRLRAAVNLIPFNPVAGCGFHPPARDEVAAFRGALRERGITVTERFRRGRDIAAACGQLRGRHAPAGPPSDARRRTA